MGQERAVETDRDALAASFRPPAAFARPPRPRREQDPPGMQVLPDGSLREWEAAGVSWTSPRSTPRKAGSGQAGAAGAAGEADDAAGQLAIASYGAGLSLALRVRDATPRPARTVSALGRADHVELELWPGRRPAAADAGDRLHDALLGVRFRLGTQAQLVDMVRPAEAWRQQAISSFGQPTASGWVIEARLPLSVLTPLPEPVVREVHYRVTVYDAGDGEGEAEPSLRFEGRAALAPPLRVPEAVQKRPSVRACMAAEREALWGFENGWRCSVPYREEIVAEDDSMPAPPLRLGHSRLPEPPLLVWIRERLLLVNIEGAERGVAALFDRKDTLLSLLPLGVINAEEPGSVYTRDSGAEPLRLPDGSWAVAVTHAFPEPGVMPGGRCGGASRVYISIISLRRCFTSTPHERAPEPQSPPELEEIARILVEDCYRSIANDWVLSKDNSVLTVRSSVDPGRRAQRHIYRDGRYVLEPIS